jgi:hypothetical protein
MKGLIQTPDPEATYRDTLAMVLRGLAPAAGPGSVRRHR